MSKMLTEQDPRESVAPLLAWPEWRWHWEPVGLFISLALGVVALLVADWSIGLRLVVVIGLLLLGLLVPPCKWLFAVLRVAWRRVQSYPDLLRRLRARDGIVESLLQSLWSSSFVFDILRVKDEAGRIYIEVRRKPAPQLLVGDQLIVVDIRDALPMGLFEITQVRENEYYAVGNCLDPMFEGYVRQEGLVTMIPNAGALYHDSKEAHQDE